MVEGAAAGRAAVAASSASWRLRIMSARRLEVGRSRSLGTLSICSRTRGRARSIKAEEDRVRRLIRRAKEGSIRGGDLTSSQDEFGSLDSLYQQTVDPFLTVLTFSDTLFHALSLGLQTHTITITHHTILCWRGVPYHPLLSVQARRMINCGSHFVFILVLVLSLVRDPLRLGGAPRRPLEH